MRAMAIIRRFMGFNSLPQFEVQERLQYLKDFAQRQASLI